MKVRQRTICHTCRARKLACDGRSPSCSQCLKSHRKCGGYQYDLIFADPVTTVNSHGKCKLVSTKTIRRRRNGRAGAANVIGETSSVLDQRLSWPTNDILSLVAQNFIPTSSVAELNGKLSTASSRICGSWIEVVPELNTNGPQGKALLSSIKAFAVAIVSKGLPAAACTVDALTAHGYALRSLQQALVTCQRTGANELSAAIMFLFLSEIILPSNRSSGIHVTGLSYLMQSRGPGYYRTGIPHKIFVGSRPSLVIQSIFHRKAFFLEETEWCTIPFQRSPAEPLQTLMSIGACIPSALEVIDRLKVFPNHLEASVCIKMLLDNMKRLDDWLHSSSSNLQHKYGCDFTAETEDIWYPDITVANNLTHYWAFWIIYAVHLTYLEANFAGLGHSKDEALRRETAVKSRSYLIMRSVKYLTQEHMKLFGATSLSLPVKVAYEYLQQYGEVSSRVLCESVVQHIKDKGYFYLTDFIQSDIKILTNYPQIQHPDSLTTEGQQSDLAHVRTEGFAHPIRA